MASLQGGLLLTQARRDPGQLRLDGAMSIFDKPRRRRLMPDDGPTAPKGCLLYTSPSPRDS